MIAKHRAPFTARRLGVVVCAAILLIGALPAGAASGDLTRTFERTVSTSATPKITVKGAAGDITIRTSTVPAVQIRAIYRAQDPSDFDAMGLDVQPTASGLDLHARIGQPSDSLASRARHGNRAVDLILTVPAGASIDIDETAGDVQIEAPSGAVHAALRAGDVTISRIVGPVWAHVSAGNVTLSLASNWDGAAIDARASVGDIEANAPEPLRARAKAIARLHVGIGDISGFER